MHVSFNFIAYYYSFVNYFVQETETLHEITNDKKQALEESEKFLMEQIETNKQTEESIKKFEKDRSW